MGYATARGGHAPGAQVTPGRRPHQPAPGSLRGHPAGDHGGGHVPGRCRICRPRRTSSSRPPPWRTTDPATVAKDKMKKSDVPFPFPLARTDDILGWGLSTATPGLSLSAASPWRPGTWCHPCQAGAQAPGHDRGQQPQGRGAGFGVETNVVTLITREGELALPHFLGRTRWPPICWTRSKDGGRILGPAGLPKIGIGPTRASKAALSGLSSMFWPAGRSKHGQIFFPRLRAGKTLRGVPAGRVGGTGGVLIPKGKHLRQSLPLGEASGLCGPTQKKRPNQGTYMEHRNGPTMARPTTPKRGPTP